jgi:hypothetical protein
VDRHLVVAVAVAVLPREAPKASELVLVDLGKVLAIQLHRQSEESDFLILGLVVRADVYEELLVVMEEAGALLYLGDLIVDAVDQQLEAEAVVLAL